MDLYANGERVSVSGMSKDEMRRRFFTGSKKTGTENQDIIEIRSGTVGGKPVVKGSRLPVADVLANFADGMTPEEIADCYEIDCSLIRAIIDHHRFPTNLSKEEMVEWMIKRFNLPTKKPD